MASMPTTTVAWPAFATVITLLLTLGLFPPETSSWSLIVSGGLVSLLVAIAFRAPDVQRRIAGLAVVAILLVPLSWTVQAPGAVVAPVGIWILAAAAGIAAAGMTGQSGLGRAAAVAAALTGVGVSLHALAQALWGLEGLADAVAARPDLPDRDALLARIDEGRAFAGFSTPAALGGFVALVLPVTAGLALTARGRLRAVWWVVVALEAGAMLVAASATAVAALLAALGLGLLVWSRSRRLAWMALPLGALLLGGVTFLRGGALLSVSDPGSPWRLRAGNFRSAWSMAVDHPWIGVGPGGFAEAYPQYRLPGDNATRHAHNLPLELAAEHGWVPGAVLTLVFFAVFVGPLIFARAGPGIRQAGVALGLAAFALHNLADYTAYMPSALWTAAILRGFSAPACALESARPPRLLALGGMAVVLAAAAVSGLGEISWNYRRAAREAAFAGETDRAEELAVRAARVAPWDVNAAVYLAQAIPNRPDLRDQPAERRTLAVNRADNAVRLSPVRPEAREARAKARLATGDLGGAYADMIQAVRLSPLEPRYKTDRDWLAARLRQIAGQRGQAADR